MGASTLLRLRRCSENENMHELVILSSGFLLSQYYDACLSRERSMGLLRQQGRRSVYIPGGRGECKKI